MHRHLFADDPPPGIRTQTEAVAILPVLTAQTVIALAKMGCKHPLCGAERAEAGSRNRDSRCSECPLDAVDKLADTLPRAAWKEGNCTDE